jgi:4-hydroxy-4-methyl-2-oxoglutarate aldolase
VRGSAIAQIRSGPANPGPDTLCTLASAPGALFCVLTVALEPDDSRHCADRVLVRTTLCLHRAPRDDLRLLSRLERLDASTVSDADKRLRVLPAAIRPVSAGNRLLGRAVTANARDDLLSVLGALRQSGPGDVLIVATGGSQHAVAGELFAGEAARRGMAGIIIDGFCRDTATLKRMTLPVYARGATPRAASAMVVPEVNVPVLLGTVTVNPGDILLGDDDGIIVATEAELAAAIDKAEAIQATEDALLSSMAEGASLFDTLNFDEHVKNLHAGKASSLSFNA